MHDSDHKGNVAEAMIAGHATRLGIPVMKPLVEHARYDLVFETRDGLIRVQCKWAPRRGDVIVVHLSGFRYTSRGQVHSTYSAEEVDAVAVYCEELDECYLLPISEVDGMRAIHLRLKPTKNGQRACLRWAADYPLGAVAQLEERCRGTAEAGGSSPPSSTLAAETEPVGIDIFRQRFGRYMERASAGEDFLITRRGKPYARLCPPQPTLTGASVHTAPEPPSSTAPPS